MSDFLIVWLWMWGVVITFHLDTVYRDKPYWFLIAWLWPIALPVHSAMLFLIGFRQGWQKANSRRYDD